MIVNFDTNTKNDKRTVLISHSVLSNVCNNLQGTICTVTTKFNNHNDTASLISQNGITIHRKVQHVGAVTIAINSTSLEEKRKAISDVLLH